MGTGGETRPSAGGVRVLLFVFAVAFALAGSTVAPLVAAGATGSSRPSAVLQKTVEAAKKEGKVIVQNLYFPPTSFSKVQEAFDRRYGFNVKIEWAPFRNYPATASQVLSEYSAGVPASVDVVRIAKRQDPLLARAGAIQKVDWAPLLSPGTPPEINIYQGWALAWKTNIYCTIYNPKKISAAAIPANWWDLANPKWKGRIVTVPWVQAYIADFSVWLDKMSTKDVLARNRLIAKNRPVFQGSQTIERRLMDGEIALSFFHPNDFVEVARRQGVTLGCKPMNYIPVTSHLLAVLTRAPHPNAAKLFTAFMVSPEGSSLLEKYAADGNQWRRGSFQAVMFAQYKKTGLPVLDWDRAPGYGKWVATKGYENLTRAINRVLRGR